MLKELGNGGLRTIEYESGRNINLVSAMRMNIQGAIRDLENEMTLQVAREIGSTGIEITVHEYPAPDHEDIQGHQFDMEIITRCKIAKILKMLKGKNIKVSKDILECGIATIIY